MADDAITRGGIGGPGSPVSIYGNRPTSKKIISPENASSLSAIKNIAAKKKKKKKKKNTTFRRSDLFIILLVDPSRVSGLTS